MELFCAMSGTGGEGVRGAKKWVPFLGEIPNSWLDLHLTASFAHQRAPNL